MLDHIGLVVTEIDRSRAFCGTVLGAIGLAPLEEEWTDLGHRAILFGPPGGEAEFVLADGERPGKGNHIAFRVASRAAVDAFHAAGRAAGGIDNGAPGLRERYAPGSYPAFIFGPVGFDIEAVHRG